MRKLSMCALAAFTALPSMALNDISWVSRSGSDANTCVLTSPCRTFQVAYNQTNSGGIVRAMDAGEYGPITISKAIVIDGNRVGASIEVTTGTGVLVQNAGAVELRNFAIHGTSSCACNGISSVNSSLNIEN